MKKGNLASITNPDDMTPAEIKTVVDFLIEKKKEGQFRTLWSSFEQAVNLLVSKEVKVLDCWEPMVFVAETKGVKAVYARPKEGYLLWAMAAYVTKNPKRPPEKTKAAYELLDFMLGPWYGAKITLLRGSCEGPLVRGAVSITGANGLDRQRGWLADALRADGVAVEGSGGSQVRLIGPMSRPTKASGRASRPPDG